MSEIDTSRLDSALAKANYQITLKNQKQNARLKLAKDLTYAINGGIFHIDANLLTFVSVMIINGKTDLILLDVNSNPIEITDLKTFHEVIQDKYHECMNSFLYEFKTINKARSVSTLVGE